MPEPDSRLAPQRTDQGRGGLWLLVIWAMLCAVWNGYGAFQLAHGGRALGPTASYAGAALALLLAVALFLASDRWPRIFRILALAAGALAGFTIWNSFVLDRSLWPSEAWRWAGIAVNAIGVAGALIAAVPGPARRAGP